MPHLTLNLPVPKERETRALGVVFEADPDDVGFISEKLIGERRLNPLEALLLVKACSSAIVQRGGTSCFFIKGAGLLGHGLPLSAQEYGSSTFSSLRQSS